MADAKKLVFWMDNGNTMVVYCTTECCLAVLENWKKWRAGDPTSIFHNAVLISSQEWAINLGSIVAIALYDIPREDRQEKILKMQEGILKAAKRQIDEESEAEGWKRGNTDDDEI